MFRTVCTLLCSGVLVLAGCGDITVIVEPDPPLVDPSGNNGDIKDDDLVDDGVVDGGGFDIVFVPGETSVYLVNDSEFTVEVNLLYHDNQDIPESFLLEVGEEIEVVLAPGEVVSFSEDCDDLQAIIIDDADLLVLGQAGPEDDTGVLRDGDDFGCGDAIVYTFVHTGVITDFRILIDVYER